MSALTPQLTIKLDLDPAGVLKGATVASKNINGVNKSIGQADKAGNKFSKTLGTMWRVSGGIILAQVIRKIAHEIEGLIGTAEDFDTAMRNVTSVTGQAGKDFQGLSDAVVNLALDPRIKDGPAALAQGLYTITSSGFSAADSMIILKQAAMAGTAGMTTTAVAADVLISTLGAYNLTADDSVTVTDQLFQIVQISKYTFEQMASAMATVTPTAAALGIGLDEIGAALATFGKRGISADTATVQMNAILTGLLKPTTAMTEEINKLGYANGEQMIETLGFTKTMQVFAEVLHGNATLAEQLFGDVKAGRGIMTLTNDDAVLLAANLVKMNDAQGQMETALKEQMKAASFQIAVLRKDLEILVVMGFGLIAPYLVKGLNYFNTFFSETLILFRHFREKGYGFFHALRASLKEEITKMFGPEMGMKVAHFVDQFEKFFNEMKHIVLTVAPVMMKFLGFLADHFATIGPMILGAVIGMKALAVILAINNTIIAIMDFELAPLTIALIAVAAIGALVALAWIKDWGGIQEKTKAVVGWIVKWAEIMYIVFQPAIKIIKAFFGYLKDVATHKIEPGNLKKLPGWLQPIAYVIGRIIKTVRVFFLLWQNKGPMAAINNLQFQIRALGRAFSKLADQFGLHNFADVIKAEFYAVAKFFGDWVTLFGDIIHGRWGKILGDLWQLLKDDLNIAILEIDQFGALIIDIFNLIPWGLIAHGLWVGVKWAVGIMWKGLKEVTKWVFDRIKSHFVEKWQKEFADLKTWYNTGRDIVSFLWWGISGLTVWIVNEFILFITDLLNAVVATVMLFYDVGHYVMMGLWKGMKDAWNWMKDELTKMWNEAPSWLRKLWFIGSPSKVFAKIGFHAMEGLAKGFKDGHRLAIKTLGDVGNQLSQGANITVNARVRPSGPVDMKYGSSGGSRLRALHLATGAIVIKDSGSPQKTAKAVLDALDKWEAGAH